MKITILAIGKQKKSPTLELCQEYLKRLKWNVTLKELDAGKASAPAAEARLIEQALPDSAFVVALDERGQTFTSPEFAERLAQWQIQAANNEIFFLIGGADGFDETIRKRAKILLSFGKQTWPHMLVRVMLLEQIYRAQQITDGHPYHRA